MTMTVNEAIAKTQKKRVGLINKISVRYAQTLLLEDEKPKAAIIANIYTRHDKYPGVVVITNKRIIAACGLPGIKRSICLPIKDLESCEESSMLMQYKVTFRTRKEAFAMNVDPDVGNRLSPYIAKINGNDAVSLRYDQKGKILSSNFINQKLLNQARKEKAKEFSDKKEIELQKKASMDFNSDDFNE